ncbi:MAG: tryptophan synthase subunit beta [Alphaproteobacteria bacterium]|nr:tryptophan synthase subunit beta [Alphaproteobacteria bacterium]
MEDTERGYYGQFGGMYITEILNVCIHDLIRHYKRARSDASFWNEYQSLMMSYSGRPTPLTYAQNLSEYLGGAQIYIKREDLNHTGAHKINNVMGQGLLTKRMGKKRVIAETGAGQHGVATATMAAKFGFECEIYMGEIDVKRQRPNVFWMEKLGAKVNVVKDGTKCLKDAINAAFRDWSFSMDTTHYVLGTACGPHPFPEMVAWFQSIVGMEARQQVVAETGKMPSRIFACVGGGSNSLGIFSGFFDATSVELVGVEAGGLGLESGKHAARLVSSEGKIGVAQGMKTVFVQDNEGQMHETHSISAGLDYIGVSPILAHLRETKRVRFEAATDAEVVEAVRLTIRKEGIIPALESAHAFAQAIKEAPKMKKDEIIVVNQSGRGDKDIFIIADALKDPEWEKFIIEKAEAYNAGK